MCSIQVEQKCAYLMTLKINLYNEKRVEENECGGDKSARGNMCTEVGINQFEEVIEECLEYMCEKELMKMNLNLKVWKRN